MSKRRPNTSLDTHVMDSTRVDFSNPPVVEVVCGVLFSTAKPISVPHVGAFWDLVRKDFPNTQEANPLAPVLEEVGGAPLQFHISAGPELPRTWFLSEDGQQIIQVQRDRFLLNWKKSADEHVYPRYETVIEQFERRFGEFRSFVENERLGPMVFRQFDLTYVNLIDGRNGLNLVKNHDLLIDHTRDASRSRFLPEPDTFNWTTSYLLPDDAGRLNIVAQTLRSRATQDPTVRLDLRARGIFKSKPGNARQWFDLAHLWITKGFVDITQPVLHKESWGRIS